MSTKNILGIYIILILIFTFNANGDYIIPSASVDNNGSILVSQRIISNIDFKGEPSYFIEVQTSSSRVNAGDNYSIQIFLSGVGDVEFGKVRVNIPSYIVKENYVILKEVDYNFSKGINLTEIILHPFLDFSNQQPQLNLGIPNMHFIPSDIKAFVNFGEVTVGGNAPYTINFTISPKAPKGDHSIHIKLFYKSGNKWYSDTQIVQLHINNWYEKEWMQIIVLASLIISIILQIIPAIPVIDDYRKKRKKYIKPPK